MAGPKMHTLHGYAEEIVTIKAEVDFNKRSPLSRRHLEEFL